MIKASFGLTETGSVRDENQDSYLLDTTAGLFAVADGLGGLPNGARASRLTVEMLRKAAVHKQQVPLHELLIEVNQELRRIGYDLDPAGFGSTLTVARLWGGQGQIELAHVGDSAAVLIRDGVMEILTVEHTVAARMAAERWQDASDAIPLTAHHTLTQCMGQDLYIDPQVLEVPVRPGDRLFLITDGVTKCLSLGTLQKALAANAPLDQVCQGLTFRVEAAGSPDNYTVVGVQF